ncbi:permease [Ruthenibacterium lactatiformans]|uniref:Permease n=1 Tax=Ruthenibacterium lactatiformans TaxID=1550024 RepID=A0A6I2U8C5_9FIRM|nr:AEC family transporter [Ruthenibacterium lactatiformans]MST91155.1 permease [Ruthenibacterium lactatiformans]
MGTIWIIVQQISLMFVLCGIGYLLTKAGKITQANSKVLGNILVYVVLPCVIAKSFLIPQSKSATEGLVLSGCISALLLCLAIVVGRVLYPKDGIAAFAAAFSNAGFFGIPLITAVLGAETVFYSAPFIALLNLLQWTYGTGLLTGEKAKWQPRRIFTAPYMIAIMVGTLFYITGLQLPSLPMQVLNALCSLNTPLAMFTLGVYLAVVDWRKMLTSYGLVKLSVVRLLIVPLLSLAVLTLIPTAWNTMKYSVLLAAACPVGANVAIYAQLYDKDYSYAVQTVVISTIASIITVPTVVWAAQMIWH